jgi:hypothetical protein
MQNMKLPYKILLVNCSIAVVSAILLALAFNSGPVNEFFLMFGLVALFGGFADVVAGLFLLFKEDKRWAQGFLLSGGVLMLLGFVCCTGLVRYY